MKFFEFSQLGFRVEKLKLMSKVWVISKFIKDKVIKKKIDNMM